MSLYIHDSEASLTEVKQGVEKIRKEMKLFPAGSSYPHVWSES